MKPRLLLSAALALAACGPIVQIGGNAKPPESLLILSATAAPRPAGGPAKISETIAVEIPGVPSVLQTLRVPVTTGASEVRYLVGASWAEQPNRQFQRLLADTLTSAGLAVVDTRQASVIPARSLSGSLREFGLDMHDAGSPQARVRFDAQIAGPRGTSVALRRFEASEDVASETPVEVAAALNRAANRVAADVAEWAHK